MASRGKTVAPFLSWPTPSFVPVESSTASRPGTWSASSGSPARGARRSSSPRASSPAAGARGGPPPADAGRVRGTIVEQGRARKILVYKKKRRKNYRRRRGHRQSVTAVRVTEIAGERAAQTE